MTKLFRPVGTDYGTGYGNGTDYGTGYGNGTDYGTGYGYGNGFGMCSPYRGRRVE